MEDLGGVPPRGLPQRHCGRGVFDGAGEGHCCGGVEADLCRLALEVNFPHVHMQNGDVCFDLMGRQPALDVWTETFLFKKSDSHGFTKNSWEDHREKWGYKL